MPDLGTLTKDPDFGKLSVDERRIVLDTVLSQDPEFSKMKSGDQQTVRKNVYGKYASPPLSKAPITPVSSGPSRADIDKFKRDWLSNIFDPRVPNQAAKALALNSKDPAWNARLKLMKPVSQAAILEHADAIRENMQRSDQESRERAGDMPFGGGTSGTAHGFLQNALSGYEGANKLQKEKGFGASAEKFVTGLLDPESIATLYGAGAASATGRVASKLVAYGFGGLAGKSAYDKLQSGDPGGAAFDLLLGGAAIGGHTLAEKVAAKKVAAVDGKVASAKTDSLAKATEKDPLLKTGVKSEAPPAATDAVDAPVRRPKRGGAKAKISAFDKTTTPEQKAETVKKNQEAIDHAKTKKVTAEPFTDWIDRQPQGQVYTRAADLWKVYKAENPLATRAEFGQKFQELAASKAHEVVTPSADVKKGDVFTFKDSTGKPVRVTGVRPAAVPESQPSVSEIPSAKTPRFSALEDENAVQERSAEGVLQRQQGEAEGAGSERGRVEQGKQGTEVASPQAETLSQDFGAGDSVADTQEGLTAKDIALIEKGPQQLETFNPVRALIGDDRYEDLNKKLSDIYLGTRATISPGGVDEKAKANALIGRDHIAQMAHESVQRDHSLARVRHAFDTIVAKTPGHAVRFMFNMEGGNVHADPAAQSYGNVFRKMLDDKRTEVQNLGTGALSTWINDYFPHIWKDPVKAAHVFGEGKRPLQGSKSFIRKRTIPTIEEGMFPKGTPVNLDNMSMAEIKAEVEKQGGLEPLSYNPAEQVQMKLQQQDRFIFGQKWFQEMQDKGLAVFVRNNQKRPSGYVKIEDEIATWRSDGNWYAPEGAGRIINNYTTPGIAGHPTMGPAYRAMRSGANMLVQAKLGLSGFHFTGESLNAMASGNAKALQELSQGKIKSAIKSAVLANTIVGTPGKYYVDGAKLYAEYLNPGSQGAKHAAMLDYLIKGGGRAEMPQEFRVGAMEGFAKALRQRDVRSGVLTALPAAMEGTMAPLMRNIVPRLKLGAFVDMMSAEIDHLGPNATLEEQRVAASRVWDSVEDRFGELTYDNLFWDNTFKDIVHLTTMAPGWNLGSARTLGGSVGDILTTKSRVKSGGRAVSERTAFGLSLVVGTAYLGYVYNKLHGNDPKTLEDLFFPVGPAGKRVQLPTYMRDVHGALTDPLTTVGNKMHPILSIVGETLSGKDYFGKPIRKDAGQYARYLTKQIVPISLRGSAGDDTFETFKKMFTTQAGRERAVGITPVSQGRRVGIRP